MTDFKFFWTCSSLVAATIGSGLLIRSIAIYNSSQEQQKQEDKLETAEVKATK